MPFGGKPPRRAGGFLRWRGTADKVERTAHPEFGMRRLFVSMLALVTLVACGDNSTTGPATVNLVGSWRLQSVNGSAVPYTQQNGTSKLEVFGGGIVISQSGSFTTTLMERVTTNGSASVMNVTTYGTVEISGSGLIFKRTDIANDPGTTAELSIDSIALTQNGLALLFVKT
jgi:hypothetical protein